LADARAVLPVASPRFCRAEGNYPHYSKCGLGLAASAGSWELVRNAASETLPQIHGIRTGVLAGSPGELHSLQFEKP